MMNNKHNITASPLDLVMHMRRTKYKKVSEYIPKYNLLNFFEGNSEKLLFFDDKNFAGIDYWLQNSLDRKIQGLGRNRKYSSINPYVYFAFSTKFRNGLKPLFGNIRIFPFRSEGMEL